jgi:hypothetical protein
MFWEDIRDTGTKVASLKLDRSYSCGEETTVY